MARPSGPDPVRETLLAILRELNRAEGQMGGHPADQALELAEIERRIESALPARHRKITVPLAVGLLLRNGLVRAAGGADYSWMRQRGTAQTYQITTQGKRFLLDAIKVEGRVR